MSDADDSGAQAQTKQGRVLELLEQHTREWTVGEISQRTGVPADHVSAICGKLVKTGHFRKVRRAVFRSAAVRDTQDTSDLIQKGPVRSLRQSNWSFTKEYLFEDRGLLSHEQTLALFARIPRLRLEVWEALLLYPQLAPSLVKRIAGEVEDAIRYPLHMVRRQADRIQVASYLREKDPYGEGLERAVLDVRALVRGENRFDGLRTPRTDTKTFTRMASQSHEKWLALQQVRMEIVRANIRLAVRMAKRYMGDGLEFGDMMNEAAFGLLKGVDRFDPHRGFKFSTYALNWVRHRLGRVRSNKARTVRIPVHLQMLAYDIHKVWVETDGNVEDIAVALDKTPKQIERAIAAMRMPISLEHPMGDGELTFEDFLPDPSPDPEEVLESTDLSDTVRGYLEYLDPRSRFVIERRFGLDGDTAVTLQSLGDILNVSRERVRQLEKMALDHIRDCILGEPFMLNEKEFPPDERFGIVTLEDVHCVFIDRPRRAWSTFDIADRLHAPAEAVRTFLEMLESQGHIRRLTEDLYQGAGA